MGGFARYGPWGATHQALMLGTANRAMPFVFLCIQSDERALAVVTMLAEWALFDIAGDKPVAEAVEDKIFGKIKDIFHLLDLHLEHGVFVTHRNITGLHLRKQMPGLLVLAFQKEVVDLFKMVIIKHAAPAYENLNDSCFAYRQNV